MSFPLIGTPEPRAHFDFFRKELTSKNPFTFVRFSDGEVEILNNHPLVISEGFVHWSKGSVNFSYPVHDFKSFVPDRDTQLRADLLASAKHLSPTYFKGLVTRSNNAIRERDFLVDLNGGSTSNLSFCDLFINENYLRFLNVIMPIILESPEVFVVANFRANVGLVSRNWGHIPIPDNFFLDYESTFDEALGKLSAIPPNSLVLSSASSLTNILGYRLNLERPDVTFLDVGTSINHLLGLGASYRSYQTQLENWTVSSTRRKILYRVFGSHRIRW